MSKSPFQQLNELAERCLADLANRDLRPQEVWFTGEPESLEGVKRKLRRVIGDLEAGLRRLGDVDDDLFARAQQLDEWETIESESSEWKKLLGSLRPHADAEHVKKRLISMRTRISELVDRLMVRAVVRDPFSRVDNSLEAVESIDALTKERELREIGLGLLDGVDWEETLDAEVVDWSARFGPQHRLVLGHFCRLLLDRLRAVRKSRVRSPALAQALTAAGRVEPDLEKLRRRLFDPPPREVDAAIASDLHYLAELAQKIVGAVSSRQRAIVKELDRELPRTVADLFRLLHLSVPRKPRSRLFHSRGMTREELERELGRRIVRSTAEDELQGDPGT